MTVTGPEALRTAGLPLTDLAPLLADQPDPLVFATVSGAHLYGFPSRDSDIDLRGAHLLPAAALLGLEEPEETRTTADDSDGSRARPGHPRPAQVRAAAAAAQRLRPGTAHLAAGRAHLVPSTPNSPPWPRASSPATTPTTTGASPAPSGGCTNAPAN